MKAHITQLILVTSLFIYACTPSEQDTGNSYEFAEGNAGITVPEGFKVVVVTDTVGYGRHIAVNDNGDIYVSLRRRTDSGGLVGLRDTDGDGVADQKEYFGDFQGTGIGIIDDYLYFSSDTSVHRYALEGNSLVPSGNPEMIVSGFPAVRQHAAKSFALDGSGSLYVNVGAPSNACQETDRQKDSPGMDPCSLLERHAGIWKFDANTAGQTQLDDGIRFATGTRHMVALNWNPVVNQLYGVQHGRDMLHNWYPDTYTEELPGEEFLLIGEGNDFGWPYCFYDQIKSAKVLSPEYGGDGEEVGRCADKNNPIMAFPGHYAPNDLLFYTGESFPEKYKNGAFIAFHGSWNREGHLDGQKGYNVVFVPFEGDLPSGQWEVFASGFAEVEKIKSPGDAVQRPTGLAIGPDGSLYISDSRKGKVYRIIYTG